MRYLVVGATGFVGSHVAEELLRMGESVGVLAPDRQKALFLAAQGADMVRGDPADAGSVAAALAGARVVVYAPPDGGAPDARDLDQFLAACRRAAPARVVVISSVEAYGFALPLAGVDERYPLKPQSPQQWAWAEAEAVAQQHAADLPITVLRPVHAFGPRDPAFTRHVVEQILAPGGVSLVGGGRAEASLIYAADIGRAVAAAARHPAAPGRTYLVRGFNTTWQEFFAAVSRQFGRQPAFRSVPYGMARLTAAWSGRQNRERVDLTGQTRLFDDGRFRREVGWGPAWELGPAVAATAAAWQQPGAGVSGA